MSVGGGGKSTFSDYDFPLKVALGFVPGWTSQNKFALNAQVGTTEEDVWNHSSNEIPLSSAETMLIASTSTADDGSPLGTGAATLLIQGLDNDFLEIEETITLDGTTDVTTTNSYIRVHRMIVKTAGSGGINAGVISATASSAASVHAVIAAGDGQTAKSQFTVPDGKYMLMTKIEFGSNKNDQAKFRLRSREFGGVYAQKRIVNLFQSTFGEIINPPLLFTPKTDVKLTCVNEGSGNIEVTGAYDFYLVDASYTNLG